MESLPNRLVPQANFADTIIWDLVAKVFPSLLLILATASMAGVAVCTFNNNEPLPKTPTKVFMGLFGLFALLALLGLFYLHVKQKYWYIKQHAQPKMNGHETRAPAPLESQPQPPQLPQLQLNPQSLPLAELGGDHGAFQSPVHMVVPNNQQDQQRVPRRPLPALENREAPPRRHPSLLIPGPHGRRLAIDDAALASSPWTPSPIIKDDDSGKSTRSVPSASSAKSNVGARALVSPASRRRGVEWGAAPKLAPCSLAVLAHRHHDEYSHGKGRENRTAHHYMYSSSC